MWHTIQANSMVSHSIIQIQKNLMTVHPLRLLINFLNKYTVTNVMAFNLSYWCTLLFHTDVTSYNVHVFLLSVTTLKDTAINMSLLSTYDGLMLSFLHPLRAEIFVLNIVLIKILPIYLIKKTLFPNVVQTGWDSYNWLEFSLKSILDNLFGRLQWLKIAFVKSHDERYT